MDKSMKKILLIGAAMIFLLLLLSTMGETDKTVDTPAGSELEALLASLDGVDQVRVVFYYSKETTAKKEEVNGIAVVYSGTADAGTEKKMYELIRSLYGIPYHRIYISR
ncbi:MAG: NYN domain-containing protein [Clostridiales bacterium]|nr:NYN domain-containing protein [Clostridiales bacterium]